jgi:MFS family permease
MDLVGRQDLLNAISLNSALSSLAGIAGPSIAGAMMITLGGGWCFALNAASYVPVIVTLLVMTAEGRPTGQVARRPVAREVLDGLRYIWESPALRATMSMALVIFIFGLNDNVIVPVFADQVLHMGARGYGNLVSAVGVGALAGAISGAAASRRAITGRTIVMNGMALGTILVGLSMVRTFWLTASMLALLGFATVTFAITASSAVQSGADERGEKPHAPAGLVVVVTVADDQAAGIGQRRRVQR